jgi:hypothetical protein
MHHVIVGNIGTVYSGSSAFEARKAFLEYRRISLSGTGRAAHEPVTWLEDEIVREELDAVDAVLPSIADIASEIHACGVYLRDTFKPSDLDDGEGNIGTDYRLQIHDDGSWETHSGSSDYDQDHRGHWGASFVPRGCTWAQAREIAKDLIGQAADSLAECSCDQAGCAD